MSRLPIRLRVTAAFALAMAAVLAGSGLYLYLQLGSHLAASLDRDLRLRAQDLAALITRPGVALARDNSGRFVERGESYAQLLTPEGRILDATRPLGRTSLLSRTELQRAERGPTYVDKPSLPGLNEGSRLLATGVARSDGRRAVLVVGVTRQNNLETLGNFRDELLIAGPIALLLASGIGYLLAGLSLRQVESMRRRAAAISGEAPGDRLPVPPTGDEVQRLGETLNEMLDRLEAALDRERDFVADAGHEFRTPLALLRTELELALRQAQTADELRAAVRRSFHEANRLSQLAEDLLLVASADRGRLPLHVEPVQAEALFASIRSRFDWRAAELGKTVEATPANGLLVAADRMRLEQALSNLVDNALRYGGDEVTLTATGRDGRVELHVRDNGTGFPSDFLAHAFDRFTRADAGRGGGGSGLGLSIVKTIAESHAGTAHVANTGTGGADAWISIPGDGHSPATGEITHVSHDRVVQSVYEAVGGEEGLLRLAQAWHARVMADEVVSHAFSHGFHPQHSERLAAYWAEALGGPPTYSELYGDETAVVRIHSGNGPHEEMDQRAIACFDQALEDVGLTDEPLRQVLHDYFAWATTTMSTYHRSADDVPQGMSIPRWSWEGLQR